jgi:transposase
MDDDKIVIRILLRHYWKKGLSARAAANEICDVEGINTVSKSTAIRWFRRFDDGDIDVLDKPRSGRPLEVDDEALLHVVWEEPGESTRTMSAELGCHHSTVARHLQLLGLTKRQYREVPHELTPEQAQSRVDVCNQLLAFPFDERFF